MMPSIQDVQNLDDSRASMPDKKGPDNHVCPDSIPMNLVQELQEHGQKDEQGRRSDVGRRMSEVGGRKTEDRRRKALHRNADARQSPHSSRRTKNEERLPDVGGRRDQGDMRSITADFYKGRRGSECAGALVVMSNPGVPRGDRLKAQRKSDTFCPLERTMQLDRL